MAIVSARILLCALVMLQISYSYAELEFIKDYETGLLRLKKSIDELTDSERAEYREIITSDDHQKYCKYKDIYPTYVWGFYTSLGKRQWCFEGEKPSRKSTCCGGQGQCDCEFKQKYKCYCK